MHDKLKVSFFSRLPKELLKNEENVLVKAVVTKYDWKGSIVIFPCCYLSTRGINLFLFFSKLPRTKGSILYCTTGVLLRWLIDDRFVVFLI